MTFVEIIWQGSAPDLTIHRDYDTGEKMQRVLLSEAYQVGWLILAYLPTPSHLLKCFFALLNISSPRMIRSYYLSTLPNILDSLGANLLLLFLYTNIFFIRDRLKSQRQVSLTVSYRL